MSRKTGFLSFLVFFSLFILLIDRFQHVSRNTSVVFVSISLFGVKRRSFLRKISKNSDRRFFKPNRNHFKIVKSSRRIFSTLKRCREDSCTHISPRNRRKHVSLKNIDEWRNRRNFRGDFKDNFYQIDKSEFVEFFFSISKCFQQNFVALFIEKSRSFFRTAFLSSSIVKSVHL